MRCTNSSRLEEEQVPRHRSGRAQVSAGGCKQLDMAGEKKPAVGAEVVSPGQAAEFVLHTY